MANKKHTVRAALGAAARAPRRKQQRHMQQSHIGDRYVRQKHVCDENCDQVCRDNRR